MRFRTLAAPILTLGALTLAAASPACGQTNFGGPVKLRVGNSAAQAFSFVPVEVGIREGIFAKNGFASTAILQEKPGTVRSFLKAWFETIVWMRAHKAESVEIARSITGFSPEVESREYDLVMPMFATNGHFQAAGLKTIEESFKDLHLVEGEPDMSTLYTEAYLPKD